MQGSEELIDVAAPMSVDYKKPLHQQTKVDLFAKNTREILDFTENYEKAAQVFLKTGNEKCSYKDGCLAFDLDHLK
jgi:hypothetical protein